MNFLIIGLGSAGQRHARVLRTLFPLSKIYAFRGDRFVGLIDKDLQFINLNIDPVSKYNLILLQKIEQTKLVFDLTIIATPASSHSFYAKKLWDSSFRILIEKPLDISLDSGKEILALAQVHNKAVFVGYQHNFNPIFTRIANIFNSHNDWYSLSCNFHESLHEMNIFRDMHKHHLSDPNEGNALLTLSHEIDFFLSVLPGDWNDIETRLASSGTFNSVLDEAELRGVYKNLGNEVLIEISLKFGIVVKSRSGRLKSKEYELEWDLIKRTLLINGITEKFDYHADDLIASEINFLLGKSSFDNELEILFARAVRILELNFHSFQ
jgi:predicted dehydrogenase